MADPRIRMNSGSNCNGVFQYCSAQIPGKLDEDRYSCDTLPQSANTPVTCSFGVFDGHGGSSEAADYCSNNLNQTIAATFAKYLSAVDGADIDDDIDESELKDALFCHAINVSHRKIDNDIQKFSDTGSTSLSLFILKSTDGSLRAYNSWVGDSRSILSFADKMTGPQVVRLSNDHKPHFDHEYRRVQQKKNALIRTLPIECDSKTFRGSEESIFDRFYRISEPVSKCFYEFLEPITKIFIRYLFVVKSHPTTYEYFKILGCSRRICGCGRYSRRCDPPLEVYVLLRR